MYQVRKDYDHVLVVMSDVEMGQGGKIDDFPHDHFLGRVIRSYNLEEFRSCKIDLVFNGDTFDFLKTPYNDKYPHLINETVALHKLEKIASAHPEFFTAVGEFLVAGSGERKVQFLVGNHDLELLFKGVQERVRILCGGSANVLFPNFRLDIGEVHIEHGCQLDPLFQVDTDKPFIHHQGETCLNLPWGSVTILNVVMPYQNRFCELDRIKPKKMLFEVLPEMREFLLGAFWRYWTRDFMKQHLRASDPLKKVTWSMIKEVFKRMTLFSPDIEIDQRFIYRLSLSERYKLYLIGHVHEAGMWSYGNRKLIQTGCMRDEFMLENGAKTLVPIPKCYAEVFIKDQRVVFAHLVETECPDLRPEHFPPLPQEFAKKVKDLLGSPDDRLQSRIEMEKQEEKEEK